MSGSLPASVIKTVKATAPVVGARSTDITGCFYPTVGRKDFEFLLFRLMIFPFPTKLFKNDPATLHYFNKSNQGRRGRREFRDSSRHAFSILYLQESMQANCRQSELM